MSALVVLLALGLVGRAPQETRTFEDPAPPVVRDAMSSEQPAATSPAELTRHATARPRAAAAVDEDWPGFLGPRRDGHSRETGLLRSLDEGEPRLLWELSSGEGWSAPAVADGVLVFAQRLGDEAVIDGLVPETGERLWRHSYPSTYGGRYVTDGGPRATPAIAGGLVFVHGAEGRLTALELHTGAVRWARDLAAEFKVPDNFFGVVASPLVHRDLLILNLGAPGGPGVAAFDQASGRLVWGAETEWGASCASPVVGRLGEHERLFVMTGGQTRPPTGGLVILEPETGRSLHRFPFRSRTYTSVNGATPVLGEDHVFVTASYNTGSALLGLDELGGYETRWTDEDLGLQFSSPLHLGDVILALDGKSGRTGALVVLDPESGAERQRLELDWEERVQLRGTERTMGLTVGEGSLLYAEGAVWCLGDGGGLLRIVRGEQGFEVSDRVSLFHALETWTPPALWHGLLFVRQKSSERFGESPAGPRLLCFDLRRRTGS